MYFVLNNSETAFLEVNYSWLRVCGRLLLCLLRIGTRRTDGDGTQIGGQGVRLHLRFSLLSKVNTPVDVGEMKRRRGKANTSFFNVGLAKQMNICGIRKHVKCSLALR